MRLRYKLIIILLITVSFTAFAQKNHFLLAQIQYQNKNYILASGEIQKYLTENTKDNNAYLLSAKINIELKNYTQAINNLLRLSQKKYPELNLLLARAYAGENNETKAIEYLSKYLKQKNKLPENEIVAFPEFGNIAASEAWQNVWAKNHYFKKELLLIDAKDAFENKNYEQAENLLNNYIIKYDAQAEVLYMKAQISASHDNYKDAFNYIDKAVSLSHNNEKYLKARAGIEYYLKKYNKALTDYNFVLQKDSLDLQVYFQRAQVYSALGLHDKALNDIEKYLLYYPEDETALLRYAKILTAGKDYLTAIRTYGKLIEKYPDKSEYLKLRADTYMKTHTYNYAIKDYSMALDLYPRDADIYYQKGMAHFHLKQMHEACAAWKRAQKYGNNKCDRLLYRYCK